MAGRVPSGPRGTFRVKAVFRSASVPRRQSDRGSFRIAGGAAAFEEVAAAS